MAVNNRKDYDDIKAGVEGILEDAPSPSEAQETEEEMQLPETNYSGEQGYEEPEKDGMPEYGNESEPQGIDPERIQSLIETVVQEKIDEMMGKVGDLSSWKEKMNNDIVAVKQEILRVQERFENLNSAIVGRVKTYDEGIKNISTEMKAMEKVFEKILEPLVTNVKELGKITEEMKKKK